MHSLCMLWPGVAKFDICKHTHQQTCVNTGRFYQTTPFCFDSPTLHDVVTFVHKYYSAISTSESLEFDIYKLILKSIYNRPCVSHWRAGT